MRGVERSAKLLVSGTNIRTMMEKLTTVISIAKSEF